MTSQGFWMGGGIKCFLFLCFYMQFLCTAWVLLKTKWLPVHTHKHTQANTHTLKYTHMWTDTQLHTITLADIHRDRHTYTHKYTHMQTDTQLHTSNHSGRHTCRHRDRQTYTYPYTLCMWLVFSPCTSGPGLVTVALWFWCNPPSSVSATSVCLGVGPSSKARVIHQRPQPKKCLLLP